MRTITALTLLAISLPLAACGSSTPNATGAATTPSSKYTQLVQFASCMRSHGVPNFPDPTSTGNGGIRVQATNGNTVVNGVNVNGPAFRSAMQACHSKLPNGGKPKPLSASQRNAMLKFSQCMRAHGVTNFPDPTFGSGGGVEIALGGPGMNPNSPVFKFAQRACGAPFGKVGGGP
jgi:hypothetical protein